MGVHLDFTNPATLHKLAALPYYGLAEALVRRVDPWWHAPEPPYKFLVEISTSEETDCPTCGCSCSYKEDISDTIEVFAANEDEAKDLAEIKAPFGWTVGDVLPPKFPTVEVPDEYLEWFEVSA